MVSVTSEVPANLSFQGASQRPVPRHDVTPPPGKAAFAALVDGNVASANAAGDRPQDNAHVPAPRRTDDPAADNRSGDSSATADRATRNNTGDRASDAKARDDADTNSSAPAGNDTQTAGAKSEAGADAPPRTKAKSADSKSDDTNSTATPSSGGDIAAGKQAEIGPDGSAAITGNAVAVALPIATPLVDVIAAPTQASGSAPAPLAIATAAIAAASNVTDTTGATITAATGVDANASPGIVTTPDAGQTTGARTDAKVQTVGAVSAKDTSADTTATAATTPAASVTVAVGAAAGSVIAGAPDTSKIAKEPKISLVAKENAATTPGEKPAAPNTADSSAPARATGIAPEISQPGVAVAKPKAENAAADVVKADTSGNPAPATANPNLHSGAANAVPAPANISSNGLQPAGAIQPPLPFASAAPISTDRLTVTATTQPAVPLSGLAMEIAATAKSGKSSFDIRLDPADLGRIDVRIDVDRSGRVTSHLTVERPETLAMLRQDAPQLARALDDAGLSTGGNSLQFSLRDQSSSGQNDSGQHLPNAHRLIVSEEESIPAALAGRSYGRLLDTSGGVDIRI